MKVAVGSRREPKVAAVRLALERLAATGWPGEPVEIATCDAPSGQADTPIGDAATLAGARARARAALLATDGTTVAVGLEGGVVALGDGRALLRNWVVAWDGAQEGIGAGPAIELPPGVARAVLAGEDLAAAIDRWASEHDVRSRQGAFGAVTRGLVPRAEAFAVAVTAALAPWYNDGWER